MKVKKLRTKEIKNIVDKFKTKRLESCYFCGSKMKMTKKRENEVKCVWKGCKKVYNLWMGAINYNSKLTQKKS